MLPLPGAVETVDDEAVASYCYDAQKQLLVTYDSVEVARRKADWIKSLGLGGAMWWESSADGAGERSVIANVVDVFGGAALDSKLNCLQYPESKYDNLKNGHE